MKRRGESSYSRAMIVEEGGRLLILGAMIVEEGEASSYSIGAMILEEARRVFLPQRNDCRRGGGVLLL